ncbi:MAG TPA: RDD family protein [Puia sp.]|nr:RDD family protein [Puia sp.]
MEGPNVNPQSETNILDDVEYTFTQASSAQRLTNYIIDRIAFYLIWKYVLSKGDIALLTAVYRYTHSRELLYILGYLIAITIFVVLLASMEMITGGKTLGKYFTVTRAVNQDGSRITPKTAFLRGVCRLVPFEQFSAFGKPSFPWHDRWSKTYVIDERRTSLPPAELYR